MSMLMSMLRIIAVDIVVVVVVVARETFVMCQINYKFFVILISC